MEYSITVAALLLVVVCKSAYGCDQRCYAPSQLPQEPIWREEEAVARARCLTACLEKAFEGRPLWPSVALTTIESYAGGSCDMLNEVDDCTESCGTDEPCTDTYAGTSCPRLCEKRPCAGGCVLYKEVVQTSLDSRTPPSPQTPPTLTLARPKGRENVAGLYAVSLPPSAVVTDGNSNNITMLLFRVEIGNSTAYYTQDGMETLLDLGHFACSTTTVSFAAVNAYGRSNFSGDTTICVTGESRYPSQPDKFLYTDSPDLREGFEGRAELNFTWRRPAGYEYIRHYTIEVFTQREDCGGVAVIHKYNIHKDATNFILVAQNRNDVPGYGCNYQVTLSAKPAQAGQTGYTNHVILSEPPTDTLAQSLDLECHKYLNDTTGKIALLLQWVLQASVITSRAVDYYQIDVRLVDVGTGQSNHIPQVKQSIWRGQEDSNGTSGAFLLHKLEPHTNKGYRFKARVTPVVVEELQWMQVPDWQECMIDTLASPPSPVIQDGITVSNFSAIGNRLNLLMTWHAPSVTYGRIVSYEVHVTREPLPVSTSTLATVHVFRAESLVESIEVSEEQIYIGDNVLCLYAQVRAKNTWVWGEWSVPVTLVQYPTTAPNCTLLPVPTPKEVTEPDKELPLLVIIISAILGCVIVATAMVLVVVVYLCRKHKTKKQMEKVFEEKGYQNPMFAAGSRHGSISFKPSILDSPKPDEWELPATSVVVEDEIAEGCFGLVHRGIVKGPLPSSRVMKNSICETVAIKFLKRSASGSERTDFLNEIDTMKTVASGNNRFVVSLVGCVTIQEPLCLITEFVMHGDLLSYLQSVRKQIDKKKRQKKLSTITGHTHTPEPYLEPQQSNGPDLEPTEEQLQAIQPEPDGPYADLGDLEPVNLISFAYQIASGMEYLASLDVVHRDLACRNILLGEHKTLKISDFGLSRHVAADSVYVKTTKGRLPWKWMAIESITNREFTTASDVWAFGVSLWEIATLGGFPYPMIPNGELVEYLKKNYRLECPENCSRAVYDIMLECWQEFPPDRPSFSQLKGKFDAMLEEDSPYIHFETINTQKPYYSSTSSGIESDGKSTDLSSELESSLPRLSPSPSDSGQSSSGLCPAGVSSAHTVLTLTSTQGVEVHLEVDATDCPAVNPYVDTPTRPYDSSFHLVFSSQQQTIEEGELEDMSHAGLSGRPDAVLQGCREEAPVEIACD